MMGDFQALKSFLRMTIDLIRSMMETIPSPAATNTTKYNSTYYDFKVTPCSELFDQHYYHSKTSLYTNNTDSSSSSSSSSLSCLWPNPFLDTRLVSLYQMYFTAIESCKTDESEDMKLPKDNAESEDEYQRKTKEWLHRDLLTYQMTICYILLLRFQCSLRGLSFVTILEKASFFALFQDPFSFSLQHWGNNNNVTDWQTIPWKQVISFFFHCLQFPL